MVKNFSELNLLDMFLKKNVSSILKIKTTSKIKIIQNLTNNQSKLRNITNMSLYTCYAYLQWLVQ